jgi:magnesium chelatase family protein
MKFGMYFLVYALLPQNYIPLLYTSIYIHPYFMIKIHSVAFSGLTGEHVEVEVDVVIGMGQFAIVGLADTAIQESKERVRSAIKNSGYSFSGGTRTTVNLAPADIRKK